METKNILLSGVGGQGTITAAKLLTTGLMNEGYDVKMSEIHGMSQRGGTVLSQVRYGDKVESPTIEKGTGDILVAFELMEAARYLDYLKEDGHLVVNNTKIMPLPVIIGNKKYPENILSALEEKTDVNLINATEEAEKLGNNRTANIILLGALIELMQLKDIDWDKIIEDNIKEKYIDINKTALRKGFSLVQ